MLEQQIKTAIDKAAKDLGLEKVEYVLERPAEMGHGDFACNLALVAGGGRELGEKIAAKLKTEENLKKIVSEIKVEGPGFINISIKTDVLIKQVDEVLKGIEGRGCSWGNQVLVEYAHPNTHKEFHIGHLRNISLGESIARILEAVGTKVTRINYQGDVGLHIAKAMWGIKSDAEGYKLAQKGSVLERQAFLGKAYAKGAGAYEEDEKAKKEILEYNQQIYEGKGKIIPVWKETVKWSLEYFDLIYKRVGTKFDRLYFESECVDGVERAKEALKKGILKKSQGAVVFDGSKYGLDTRVFINSQGLPTYEAKELALAPKQFKENPGAEKNIHVVGPEQKSFFSVTFKVEELMWPEMFKDWQYHRVYEFVDLKEGKMSSRKGQVVTGWWVLDEAKKRVEAEYKSEEKLAEQIAVGAVKYGFLKVQPMSKIKFDFKESISLEGNSGPYLQYTYARCQSVLGKVGVKGEAGKVEIGELNQEEEYLLRVLGRYEETVRLAAEELSPNQVANWLYEVAQRFNGFYNKHQILKAEKNREMRLWLTKVTGELIKQGLGLLGIEAPEKM